MHCFQPCWQSASQLTVFGFYWCLSSRWQHCYKMSEHYTVGCTVWWWSALLSYYNLIFQVWCWNCSRMLFYSILEPRTLCKHDSLECSAKSKYITLQCTWQQKYKYLVFTFLWFSYWLRESTLKLCWLASIDSIITEFERFSRSQARIAIIYNAQYDWNNLFLQVRDKAKKKMWIPQAPKH